MFQTHFFFGYEWTTVYWSHFTLKLERTLWISAILLIFMAIMLLFFLLQLVNSFEGLSGAEHETLCTTKACYTLHMENVIFHKAQAECENNGGYLMTLRDRQEEDVLLSLLSLIQRQDRDRLKLWIGLKLHREDCVVPGETLKGFKWVSGEKDSNYSNWKKEPAATCTEERCVKVDYTFSGHNQLKWAAGTCKTPAPYACKFYFKGTCKPLALAGRGQIKYTAPFSKNPQKSEMKLFPHGTYAHISCSDQQHYYSVCQGLNETYNWINPGPFCTTEKRKCEINNGGCEHLCQQSTDTDVQCLCKDGYDLGKDGLSCRRIHLCGPDTCEHQCVITESGFSCKCPEGFKLHNNQRNCSDIDECKSKACGDHLCINTRGSYECVCNEGYEMVDGRCGDVDECAKSRCDHNCLNNIGSYSCNCNKGFTLSKDGHSCEDIGECVSSGCLSGLTCINTKGSFQCISLQDSHLNANPSTYTPTEISSSDGPTEEETQESFTESLTRTTVELQHQSPHTDAPLANLGNHTQEDQQTNTSSVTTIAKTANYRVIICVLGSVIPLILLVAVTLFIAIFRCSRSKKEAKKSTTADGYCWVSSGLDPRLEKLYESILTDDP